MPPRSTGCFTCRKRKIRCDEGRPGCQRCATHGVPCTGYRREKGVVAFEDQTNLTVQRAREQHTSKSLVAARKSRHGAMLSPGIHATWQSLDAFQTWSLAPLPQTFSSPAADQAQMYQKFIEIYTPKSGGISSIHFNYLWTMAGLVSSQPALKDGLNTLALVQVGSIHKDERLLKASVASYGRALGSLAKAVSKATSVHDDTVLAAATLLVVCEFYDEIRTAGAAWFGHIMGVEQLLHARGPESLTSDLSLYLFCNARIGSLARSFLLRSADPYSTPGWRLAALRSPVEPHLTQLFDSAGQVPGLLERHDRLDLDSPRALFEIEELLSECEKLELNLRRWLQNFHRSLSSQDQVPYAQESIAGFNTFASIVSDRTLPTAYRFTDFNTGYLHAQYWIAMHYLRSNIKSLRELRQSLDSNYEHDLTKAVTDEELNGYAFDLCRCIPSFLEPDSGTQGHIGCFLPLGVIMFHFRQRQNWKWLRWGLEVKSRIFTKGLRQPQVKEEDLPTPRVHLPPKSLSMFHAGKLEREEELERKEQLERGSMYDDMADVSLVVDWGQKMPGMAAIANGPPALEVEDDSTGSNSAYGFNDSTWSEPEDLNLDFMPMGDFLDFSTAGQSFQTQG